jgi:hypothetical protein
MRRIFVFAGFALVACYSSGEGIAPPLASIYFPVGLGLSRDGSHLYVVNSDFDLQYSSGTLQSLNLNRVREFVPRGCNSDDNCPSDKYCDLPTAANDTTTHSFWCVDRSGPQQGQPCGVLGIRSNDERVTIPGRCSAVDLQSPQDAGSPLLADAVTIGAFATDMISRNFPDNSPFVERIFVPVRGEATLNWVDVTSDGRLDCGQSGGQSCDKRHRAGQDPSDNSRGLRMPSEPYAIAATSDASAIVVTHQTQGSLSLFVNDWEQGPTLTYIASGLPTMPIAVSAAPEPAIVQSGLYSRPPGFLVAYETTPEIDLFRFASDALSAPARPYLERVATAGIGINSGSYDIRGLAIDDSRRRACESSVNEKNLTSRTDCENLVTADARAQCEAACLSDLTDGLTTCAGMPIDIYASSRSPASLLIAHTTANTIRSPNSDLPYFTDALPLPTGPSRIAIGQIINEMGKLETRVFVACFDSRRIAIYDPTTRGIEALITTGRGPQALALDTVAPSNGNEGHAYAFVGHFTDSYIGVIELDRRRGRNYGDIVLSIGPATPPRASK